jgi:hypothetical protein
VPAWDDLSQDLRNRFVRQRVALVSLCQTYAGRWEAEAKRVAPWTDRTGNARNRLAGRAMLYENTEERFVAGVRLSHGVDYGVWLEVTDRPRGRSARPAIRRVIGDIPPGPQNREDFYRNAVRVIQAASQ